jgi:DHA1 family bicyclomycin/chloramphenicol resistance-like MFS transporter
MADRHAIHMCRGSDIDRLSFHRVAGCMNTAPRPRFILTTLGLASALGVTSSTMYIPALPEMAIDLDVPIGDIQLTVALYVIFFGIGNLVLGPLSDRFGRRRILFVGNIICLVASLICMLATHLQILLWARILQALGACAGSITSRAMVRDLFDREGTARAMTTLSMAVTLVPVLAPILGGYLQIWFGWRSIFLFLAVASAVVMLFARAFLPETNVNLQNQTSLLRGVGISFMTLLKSRSYIGYLLAITSIGGSFYAFIAASPIILISIYGLTPVEFGIYTTLLPIGFIIGSWITNRVVGRLDLNRLIFIGGVILLIAGVAQLAVFRVESSWAVIVPLFIVGLSNGLIMPTVYAASVSLYPHLAGAAAGLTNATQNLSAAATTLIISRVVIETSMSLAVAYIITSLLVLVGALLIRKD